MSNNDMNFIHNAIRGNKTLDVLDKEIEEGVKEKNKGELEAITIRIPKKDMETIEKISEITNRSKNNIINFYINECNQRFLAKHDKLLIQNNEEGKNQNE